MTFTLHEEQNHTCGLAAMKQPLQLVGPDAGNIQQPRIAARNPDFQLSDEAAETGASGEREDPGESTRETRGRYSRTESTESRSTTRERCFPTPPIKVFAKIEGTDVGRLEEKQGGGFVPPHSRGSRIAYVYRTSRDRGHRLHVLLELYTVKPVE